MAAKVEIVPIVPEMRSNGGIRKDIKKTLGKYKANPDNPRPTILVFRPAGRPKDDFKFIVQPEIDKYEKIILIVASTKPTPFTLDDVVADAEKFLGVLQLVLSYDAIDHEHEETKKCFIELKELLEPWKSKKGSQMKGRTGGKTGVDEDLNLRTLIWRNEGRRRNEGRPVQ